MSIQPFLKNLQRVAVIVLLSGVAAFGATPPEGIDENVSLIQTSAQNLLLISDDLKTLVRTIEQQKEQCRFSEFLAQMESKVFEEKLLSCSRRYRSFKTQVHSLKMRILKESIFVKSGRLDNFSSFKERALKNLAHIDQDLSFVEGKLNKVADTFIDEFAKVQVQRGNAALGQASIRGAYKGICAALKGREEFDESMVPLNLERAKDYGDLILIHAKVLGMLQITKIFLGKCPEPLNVKTYQDLSNLIDTYLVKYDPGMWVRETCQRLSKSKSRASACPLEFKIDSYLVNFLKTVGADEK